MQRVQEIYIKCLCDESKCLWPSRLFSGISKVFIFDNAWVIDKHLLLKEIENINDYNKDYIFIPDPAENSLLKGIYNRKSGMAILNESLVKENSFPLAQIEVLTEYGSYKESESTIQFLQDKEASLIYAAKTKLSIAKDYYNEIRKIHDSAVNNERLEKIETALTYNIFKDQKSIDTESLVSTAYFGASAAGDLKYLTQVYHSYCNRCYLLKGQGITATSSILNRLAKIAKEKGFDIFLYYCPFYTEEIDCLVIPEIKTMVLDCEEPHEIEPLHPNEWVVPIEDECSRKETIFSHALELRELEAKYKQHMRQAVWQLQEYGKYKRQELSLLDMYKDWSATNIIKLLNEK